jgi:hypothetical protein
MKIALAFAIFWLTVGASGQESQKFAGEIHGIVAGQDRKPAKGMRLGAVMQCPGACAFSMRDTITNQAGEYRFQRLPLGKYSVFKELGAPPLGVVELTVDHPNAELRAELPPKAGILMIHLTDRVTGAIIPRVLVKVVALDGPDSRWSELWADSSDCLFYPDCAIPVPPDKQLLVHVSSAGFQEWNESAGRGKPILVHTEGRLTWNIQLEPLPH